MFSNKSLAIIVVSTVLPVLGAIVVALRVSARRYKTLTLDIDDFLIMAALVIVFCHCALFIAGCVRGGIGSHLATLQPHTVTTLRKLIFALQLTYLSSVTVIRLSILFFYRRIFITSKFTLIVNILCVVTAGWFITFFFATLLKTIPISGNWNSKGSAENTGHAINEYAMYTTSASLEVVLDTLTLILPLPVIWRLQIKTTQKFLTSGIFLLGSFVCVASGIRLYYNTKLLHPSAKSHLDLSYSLGDLMIWSAVEPCGGLICACLPTLGPILHKRGLQSIVHSLRNLWPKSGNSKDNEASFIPSRRGELGTGNRVYSKTGPATNIEDDDVFLITTAETGSKPQSWPDELPLTEIQVDKSYEQKVERRKESEQISWIGRIDT